MGVYIFLRVHIKILSIAHSADEILSFKGEENDFFVVPLSAPPDW
jgi:hypothetical protein